jgi:hypothetical protein
MASESDFEHWFAAFYAGAELNTDLVKATLRDYFKVQREVAAAYHHLTGGAICSADHPAAAVIEAVETRYAEQVQQAVGCMLTDEATDINDDATTN